VNTENTEGTLPKEYLSLALKAGRFSVFSVFSVVQHTAFAVLDVAQSSTRPSRFHRGVPATSRIEQRDGDGKD
jgi:hypothetical protein